MELIDTHAHLYLDQFDGDREEMIARAKEQGVGRIYLPNIDMQSLVSMNKLCDAHPGFCYPMIGLHPCDVKENFRDVLSEMEKVLRDPKYIAIGETGIDMYWDKTTLPQQIESFKIQIQWAKDTQRPIVIHARDSYNEIFSVLDEVNDDELFGVFHCFTGSVQQAKKIAGYGGFMMGIGGVLTFQNSGLQEVVSQLPIELLVLETDSPFLAPKPHRGKRNESAYVRIVAEKMAEIYSISLDQVAAFTTRNAMNLFQPGSKF